MTLSLFKKKKKACNFNGAMCVCLYILYVHILILFFSLILQCSKILNNFSTNKLLLVASLSLIFYT